MGDGRVEGVVAVDVEWACENGRMAPRQVPGSERTLPAGLVLTAMGFTGPERTLIDALQLETDQRGNVLARCGGYQSSLTTVFAAGDMRRGPSLVVWALHEGRQAAVACHRWLNGAEAGA